ncbi:MAG: hypothetical protein H0X66_01760 [Verrucomicrobia bacterium]|nr:hypothetical protein [Verrucomicrobiota bacterium]
MKLRWRIAIGVLGVFLLFGLSHFIFNKSSQTELEKYKAELRGNGEKLTLAEVLPERGTNEAALEDFVAVVGSFQNTASKPWDLPWFEYASAGEVVPLLGQSTRSSARSSLDAVLADLRTFKNSFEDLHGLAKNLELNPTWDTADPYVSSAPLYVAKRTSAQWLGAAAIAEMHAGNSEAAIEHLLALINLSRFYENDFSLAHQMIRQAVATLGFHTTWQVLHSYSTNCSEADLKKLQHRWESFEIIAMMEHSFISERARFLHHMDLSRSTPPSGIDDYLWQSLTQNENELLYLSFLQSIIEGLRSVKTNKPWSDSHQNLTQHFSLIEQKTGIVDRVRYSLTLIALPNFKKLPPSSVRNETSRRLTVTAIALKRYQTSKGRLPSDLNALIPEFITAVPIDCMDGKPLKYKLNPDGTFLLYSIGENGKDDGGDPTSETTGTTHDLWSGRDAVWPKPASLD